MECEGLLPCSQPPAALPHPHQRASSLWPPISGVSSSLFPSVFPTETLIPFLPLMFHVPHPSHYPQFDHPISCEQNMKV